jgi:hypothetical protein
MGISLNGLTPAGTYPGLIKTGDNTAISGTPKVLSDGNGNNLPMEVSTTGVNFTNNLTQGGTALQSVLVSGTNIKTINGASVLGSGNIVTPSTPPSGIAGAIQFSAGSAFNSDAANLFWDDTNNRLGVGTNAPTGRTQITESFTTIANNYSAITFDGTITSRATASDTIFGFRNTQSIVSTATGQTIIANDLTPNFNYFDFNTDSIGLRIGGLKNTQNNQSAILMQQTATAGNNGLAIQPANSRWQIGFCSGQSNQIANARVVYGPSGIRIATSSAPANNLFEIIGTGSTSATTSLLVQNSAGAESFKVQDNGFVTVGSQLNLTDANNRISAPSGAQVLAQTFHGFKISRATGSTQTMFEIDDAFITTAGLLMNVKNTSFANMFAVNYLGQASMGTASPNASAQFQINSTTRGFLPPVMTTTQKNAIASPAAGLVVYDLTTNKLCCYNGSTWNDLF